VVKIQNKARGARLNGIYSFSCVLDNAMFDAKFVRAKHINIIPLAAMQLTGALTDNQRVIPSIAKESVITSIADQNIAVRGALQPVIADRAFQHRHRRTGQYPAVKQRPAPQPRLAGIARISIKFIQHTDRCNLEIGRTLHEQG